MRLWCAALLVDSYIDTGRGSTRDKSHELDKYAQRGNSTRRHGPVYRETHAARVDFRLFRASARAHTTFTLSVFREPGPRYIFYAIARV